MSVSTHGLRLKHASRFVRQSVELLSAMRFAIALLTVICIASIIGTVLKQNEAYNNYINQFGPLWAQVFDQLGLFTVYSAWWFLLILLFLVISTSLCVARNTPAILRDWKNYKEHLRETSIKAFVHNAQWQSVALGSNALQEQIQKYFAQIGWKTRLQARANGVLIAAKTGAGHKLGYLAAHSSIVLVCVGGLIDGDSFTRAQMWWGNKVVFTGAGMIADVPATSRLAPNNPAFRGNLLVAEGQTAGTAILQQPTGVLLQDLPFAIELKKFEIDFYSTGMPKLFASDIVIHDRETGEKKEARVEVNHPVHYKGINIYQSSFDDGGSSVTLSAMPLATPGKTLELRGVIGSSTQLSNDNGKGDQQLTLEYTALRPFNVETFAKKDLRNVGPSVTYKLRDAAGQAREYNNYMLPIQFDDAPFPQFLFGVREQTSEPFRYLRVPSDTEEKIDGFVQLYRKLQNEEATKFAIDRYIDKAIDPKTPNLRGALQSSSERVMTIFSKEGLQGIGDFLEKNVPEEQREKTSEVLIRILNGVLYEMTDPKLRDQVQWLNLAMLALSEATSYPAPMIFQLKSFEQVQASVFQVAKAPGQPVVYLGALLLIVGVFFMLYIRERRIWIWIKPLGTDHRSASNTHINANANQKPPLFKQTAAGAEISIAYTSNRRTLQSSQEFEKIKAELQSL